MAPKTNALAEFTRLPTQQKVLLFVIVGMALGAIYYYVIFKSLDSRLDEARGAHEARVQQLDQLNKEVPLFQKLQAGLPELNRKIADNTKMLPSETELPAFFATINRRLIESGVELVKTTNQPEKTIEGFVKVPIDFEVTGTYLQLKRFFASLAQKDLGAHDDTTADDRERIISIENVVLQNPTVHNGSVVLDAKFTAATFRLAEADNAGSGAGSGAGSAAPATTPPPSAPLPQGAPLPSGAPMPSAATPAGAKARVEQSIQKGADRDANGGGVNEAKTPAGSGTDRLKGGM